MSNSGTGRTPRHAFERRLTEYIEELGRGTAMLLKRDHQVAFIGSIGVGKSTAICKLSGLEVQKEDGTVTPVLEVGGAGSPCARAAPSRPRLWPHCGTQG